MILNLCCIVEGHGDVQAVPILLRRLQQEFVPELYLNIAERIRVPRNKLVKAGELEKAVELSARKIKPPRAIIVLIDADDDCPAQLGPSLLARARLARPDVPVGVVLAKSEFEAWFLAAVDSLRGRRGLSEHLPSVPDPEGIRNAKGFLTRHMQGSRAYLETSDQPALAAVFDMKTARQRSDSFDKCCREIERLFAETVHQSPQNG